MVSLSGTFLLFAFLGVTLAQVSEIPNLSRGDLTVNIVVKFPEDTLEEYEYFNAPFFLRGNGLCLSWDEGTVMEHTREDTWELTLTFTQTPDGYGCNDTRIPGLIGVNSNFEFRVIIDNEVEMLGANCGSDLPISMSAPFYEETPEIHCNPWFFTTEGSVLIESVEGEPDFIRTRKMHFYLPPSFDETFYKQYPVVFAPDVGYGIPDMIYDMEDRMQIFRHSADDMIVNQAIIEETIFIGSADYKLDPRNPILLSDRFDALGPRTPSYALMCASGTFFEGCDGCFNISEIQSLDDIIEVLTVGGCGGLGPTGGFADTYLDFWLNQVLVRTVEIAGERALIDQENLGIFGCSLGGLFSCYAAWTRPEYFGHAGCQSSSFWWPQNETNIPQFHFENIYIHENRDNRPFQNIFMDFSVPGDTGDPLYQMAEAAMNLANSMADLPGYKWNSNLWLDGFMGKAHGFTECIERAWVPLSEFYRPIGGPRNPISAQHSATSNRKVNDFTKLGNFIDSVDDLKLLESSNIEKIMKLMKEHL